MYSSEGYGYYQFLYCLLRRNYLHHLTSCYDLDFAQLCRIFSWFLVFSPSSFQYLLFCTQYMQVPKLLFHVDMCRCTVLTFNLKWCKMATRHLNFLTVRHLIYNYGCNLSTLPVTTFSYIQ